MNRADLLNLIQAALAVKQPAFARRAAQRFLQDWPGDLGMQYALARACAAEEAPALAADVLDALTLTDPEHYPAHRLLATLRLALGHTDAAAHAFACAQVGDGRPAPGALPVPAWVGPCRAAFLAQRVGDWATALRESESILSSPAPSPLPSLIHLNALWQSGQLSLALPLAEGFHLRWPKTVAITLCLAECLLPAGEHARAIELLHDAAALDSAGDVVARHWGAQHPYRSLWNAPPAAVLPGPMPAELVALLGHNRLAATSAGAQRAPVDETAKSAQSVSFVDNPELGPALSEELLDIQARLDAVAARLPSKDVVKQRLHRMTAAQKDSAGASRYVILSSKTRLMQAFGAEGFAAVDAAVNVLAASVAARTDLQPVVLYIDDPSALGPLGLRPVNPANAWDVKTLVGQLAARFKDRQSALGALLIVGGPEIVPFHHLPNPTDDSDADIPSDNPYATADENYFVPEWPVGRIPSGAGRSPAPLIRALKIAAGGSESHALPEGDTPGWLYRLWRRLVGSRPRPNNQRSFGYSANVWREASEAVYSIIGDPQRLLTSPPVDANALPVEGLAPARLSYFNLHGIEDGPEWYGQRGAGERAVGPEYPVALRPADVVNSGRAPLVVFSEACYGANVLGKNTEDALCLRFLDSGTRALVGSTKIAYGAVATPLIGADLLGHCFWQNVNAGLPVGEALRRAKLQCAQELHSRQGFLDGEDQKTLISFVLYGDPLYAAPGARSANAKRVARALPPLVPPTTVCDKADEGEALLPEMEARVKAIVAQYLPGMRDAQWRVAHPHVSCQHDCPTTQVSKVKGSNSLVSHNHRTTVVTLSKTIQSGAHAHPHFARLTLADDGAVMKVVVSR